MARMLERFLKEIVPEGPVPLAVNIRDLITAWDKHTISRMTYEKLYDAFPSVVPPKTTLWMEHSPRQTENEMFGALAFSVESFPDWDLIDTWHEVTPYDFSSFDELYFEERTLQNFRSLTGDSRQMAFFCLFEASGGSIKPLLVHGVHLDKSGRPLPILGRGCLILIQPETRHRTEPFDYYTMVMGMFRPFLYVTALTNCENIKLVPKKVPLSPGLRRKRERQGIATVPFCEVHFQTPTAPDIEADRWEKIDYLAAGSFADYRDGEGLFGKYKGIYFVKGK